MKNLRSLPKVDALSRIEALSGYPEKVRIEAARAAIESMRNTLLAGEAVDQKSAEALAVGHASVLVAPTLRRVVNLSGVILHTGLGRARLAPSAAQRVAEVASQHSLLEFDLETGKRGDRQDHVRGLLRELTGAEDAFVVNNAAAAVVLALSTLARGREVVLSRGQMVEIGGSFRMPEIVRESGCDLVEVGCTNKTRISDYERALGDRTGAILRCHTSNYKIVGFAEQPSFAAIVQVAHAYGVPCIDDMGTGCIVDTTTYGMPRVPTIQDSIRAGADLVAASGDKLLGGPQAGILAGRSSLIAQVRKHPLARAVRADKLTMAAMEATLRLYAQGREREIPTIGYLARSLDQVRVLATRLASAQKASMIDVGITEIGGGSAPGTGVPTWRVGIPRKSAEEILERLRRSDPCIIARIEEGTVWLDPRTLDESEIEEVCEVLASI